MQMLKQNSLDTVLNWTLTSSDGLTGSNTSTDIKDTTSPSTRTLTHPRTTLPSTDIHLVMALILTLEPRDLTSQTQVKLISQLEDTELAEEEELTTSYLGITPLKPTVNSLGQAKNSSRLPSLIQLIKTRLSSKICSPTINEHLLMKRFGSYPVYSKAIYLLCDIQ